MSRTFLVCAGLLISCCASAHAQVDEPVGKRGLELTLVDSDIPQFTDFRPRINSMRVPPDGTDRRFLVRMTGELYAVETNGTVHLYADLLSIFGPDFVSNIDIARGFTSIAFHPEFATNGLFYTVHVEEDDATGADHAPVYLPPANIAGDPVSDRAQHCVLVEWNATDPIANTFAGSRREIMRIQTAGWWHPMGEIRFNELSAPGDEDYALLYIAMGDGESFTRGHGGNDPALVNNLQRLDSYLGTILRIDPLGSDGPNGLYGIPPTNPYASDNDPDTFGEIFVHGMRNPHRFGWDPVTGAMLAYDIGEFDIEEVNIIHPGRNYGWPEREGAFTVGAGPLPPDVLDGTTDDGFEYPVLQFDHGDGRAIAGGEICRGCGVPSIEGKLITGNIPDGSVFAADLADLIAADDGVPGTFVVPERVQLVYNGQRTDMLDIINLTNGNETRVDLRFGRDADNTLYVMNKRDGYLRTIASGPCRADLTTTSTNPGEAGYGEPDGDADGADLSFYVEAWLNADSVADTTTQNVNPGDIGWGVPNTDIDGADLSYFVEQWLAGCS